MRWGGDFGRMGDGGMGEDAGRRGGGQEREKWMREVEGERDPVRREKGWMRE